MTNTYINNNAFITDPFLSGSRSEDALQLYEIIHRITNLEILAIFFKKISCGITGLFSSVSSSYSSLGGITTYEVR